MSKQVFINGEEIDLNEKDNPIAASYAVNNLAEIKDRQAYATNSFKAPKTERNMRIMGIPDSENFIGVAPYRNNTAKIIQNGIEIVTKGVGIIQGTTDVIQLQILSGIKKFFETIEDRSINELNLEEFDHVFNTATIRDFMFHTTGVTYPLVDYGNYTPAGNQVNTKTMRPAMFLHTIMNKIFEEAGYTFSGDIFSDEVYLTEIIPFGLDKFVQGERGTSGILNNNVVVSKNAESTGQQNGSSGYVYKESVPFGSIVSNPGNHWQFGNTTYVAGDPFTGKIRVGYDLELVATIPGNKLFVVLEKFNGATWDAIAEQVFQDPDFNGNAENFPGNVIEVTHSFNASQWVRLSIYIDNDSGGVTPSVTGYKIPVGATFTVTAVLNDQILPGQTVQMEATLPDIDQKNLLKDFMQRKGLTVIQDDYSNHLTFVKITKVYDNKTKAVDWTDKFVDKTRNISYVMSGYGVQNWGRFKKDNTVTEGYGDGFFLLDNLTVKNKVDLFTSVFAATQTSTKLDGQTFPLIKKTDLPDGNNNLNGKTEPRILVNRVRSCNVILVDDFGGSFPIVNGNIPFFTEFGKKGLTYKEMFDEHYTGLIRMLFRPFILKARAILNEYDIASLDWTVPVYNSYTGTYYYLNEINNYIEGQPTEVGLIKL